MLLKWKNTKTSESMPLKKSKKILNVATIDDHVQPSTKFQMLNLDGYATCAIRLWYLRKNYTIRIAIVATV